MSEPELAAARAAVAADPDDTAALIHLAAVQPDDPPVPGDEADAALERAVALAPHDLEVLIRAASLRVDREEWELARGLVDRAAMRDPPERGWLRRWLAFLGAEIMLHDGSERGLELMEEVFVTAPDTRSFGWVLAERLAERGRWVRARAVTAMAREAGAGGERLEWVHRRLEGAVAALAERERATEVADTEAIALAVVNLGANISEWDPAGAAGAYEEALVLGEETVRAAAALNLASLLAPDDPDRARELCALTLSVDEPELSRWARRLLEDLDG